MHKFTIFTIILSTVVVLIVADVVLNDYWGEDFASEDALDETISAEVTAEVTSVEDRGDEEETATDEPSEIEESTLDSADIELPEETPVITTKITEEALSAAGFSEVTLITESYDGLIYGFWDTSDAFADFTVLRHKVFSNASYTASYTATFYEIQTPTEVAVFEAYQTLSEMAATSESGEINENNTYGDGSFYFNHSTKTNTVFLVFYKNGTVYAFEYGTGSHIAARNLIDLL